jgi:hypothetical protein
MRTESLRLAAISTNYQTKVDRNEQEGVFTSKTVQPKAHTSEALVRWISVGELACPLSSLGKSSGANHLRDPKMLEVVSPLLSVIPKVRARPKSDRIPRP